MLRVRFLTSLATARANYIEGQVVDCEALPREWQPWLRAGVIELVPAVRHDAADLDPAVETATLAASKPRGRRAERSAPLA